jgi:signal transduction histidine kinase
VDQALANPGQRLQFTSYDASDGLRGDPIALQNPVVPRTADGRLWFITSDGLAVINSHRVGRTRVPPLVNIEQAVANDQVFGISPDLRLPSQTSRLQINFTALSFTAPQKIRFSYRLEGYDREWVDGGLSREAVYTNLRPGTYRFLVSAMNGQIGSENPAVWEFSIAPAFYQTEWFLLSAATAAVLVAGSLWRLRVRQMKTKFSAILGERARIAREIHDTLLQSLYGVALRLDRIGATVSSEPHGAQYQLHVLRQQVEYYVREARQSIRDLRSPVLETKDLPAALKEAVDRITSGQPVECDFRVTGKPRRADAKIEENLLRIGQEAVSNAVRHANARRVQVELGYDADRLLLHVADDGEGFDTAVPTTENHWGLTNIQERSEQIGAKFHLQTQPGAGTTIEVEANLASAFSSSTGRARAS